MALAAAQQGKYAAFHEAMFLYGPPSETTIASAAKAAGLDMEAARAFAGSRAAEFEVQKNIELARQLGFDGTPSWVAGEKAFAGAVGRERLAEAVEAARKGA